MGYGTFSKATQVAILADDCALRYRSANDVERASILRYVTLQTRSFRKAFKDKLLVLKVEVDV